MLIRVVHKSYSAVFMVEGIPSCGRTIFCVSAPQLVDVMGNFSLTLPMVSFSFLFTSGLEFTLWHFSPPVFTCVFVCLLAFFPPFQTASFLGQGLHRSPRIWHHTSQSPRSGVVLHDCQMNSSLYLSSRRPPPKAK